jgi:hypothetical protein
LLKIPSYKIKIWIPWIPWIPWIAIINPNQGIWYPFAIIKLGYPCGFHLVGNPYQNVMPRYLFRIHLARNPYDWEKAGIHMKKKLIFSYAAAK